MIMKDGTRSGTCANYETSAADGPLAERKEINCHPWERPTRKPLPC